MRSYRITTSADVAERIRHLPPEIKQRVRDALRAIGLDPGRGDPLRLELQGLVKFRVRRFRIIYRVDRGAREVAVVAVGHRRSIYEELATAVRSRSRG